MRTIELAPKWEDLMRWMLEVLEDRKAPERSKKPIREELMRLAKFADECNVERKAHSQTRLFDRNRRRR
jgi:hypothetical protein